MAYELYYTAHFENDLSQDVEIYIYKKDGDPVEPEAYEVRECQTTDNSDGMTKFDCIIVRELLLTLFTTDDKSLTWETFITAEHDEWKIEVLVDTKKYFEGFITPDEGNGPFLDKPYDVTFRATNGLALLKGQELSDVNGDEFDSDHTLIEYIAGALKKTGLDLPIRIYCGYFHEDMDNKADSLDNDMFQQAKLNYRTFQQNPTTFASCYDALKIILDKFCTLEYWDGLWVISAIGEKQYNPNPDGRYNVDYNADGTVIGGNADPDNYGQIGRNMDLFPIRENALISSRYAVKSAKTKYTYTPWPEIPKNNRFERVTFRSEVDNGDGTVTRTYDIHDWTFGQWLGQPTQLTNLPSLVAPTGGNADARRESVFNQYGIEISREIWVGGENSGSNQHKVLQSEGIPVRQGDKVKISFDYKKTFSSTGTFQYGAVYIKPDAGTWPANRWTLESANSTLQDGGPLFWQDSAGGFNILSRSYASGDDVGEWHSITLDPPEIPIDGTLYFWFYAENPDPSNFSVYRNFDFEYFPFVANGYIQVKGDYWVRNQTANFPDVIDDEVFISDSRHKVLKGALLFNGQLTEPNWYRHGPTSDPNVLNESRHFKEILNVARFNHSYRRMYSLEGDLMGLNFSPENDPGNKRPISFFATYRETDMTPQREFVLVPPLTMDIASGQVTANLVEVKKDDNDGTQEGTGEFKYQF